MTQNTAAKALQQNEVPVLTAVKGFKDNKAQLDYYIQAAWLTVYTALYNGLVFSTTEKEQAQQLIKQWLLQQPDVEKGYKQMVQRVLLTRQYLHCNTGKYLPVPTAWLNAANSNGFAGTSNGTKACSKNAPQCHCTVLS